jgi:chromosome segregation ATPase
MRSKAEIEADLYSVRNEVGRLQINVDTASWEINDKLEKRRILEAIINGGDEQFTRDMAQMQHEELCRDLADLCNKQEQRVQELQRLKDLESALSESLQSAS